MDDVKLTGLGAYLPRRMLKNQEIVLDPPLSLEQMDKIGILRRGVAGDDEDVVEMAKRAAQQALAEAERDVKKLDFLILANWTERRYVPDFAPRIQQALGADKAFAFDVCCACSGFLYGLSIAHGYLQNPRFSCGAVIASDRSTRMVRPKSRGTLVFGDGAAAAIVERGTERGGRLIDYELRTDGAFNGIMGVEADGYLRCHIEQRVLNDLAGRTIAETSKALLVRNHMSFDDIDWLIPHSGTAGVQAMVAERLEFPRNKILTNLPEIGNVTTASIPAALKQFRDQGLVRSGQTLLSAAVGLGWQSVAMLYTL